jgi:hypothetical protein
MSNLSSIPDAADPSAIAGRVLQRAWNRDGLPEMAMGLCFLLSSGLIYATVALPRGSITGVVAAATGVIVAVSGVDLAVELGLLFGCTGLASLITGSFVFLRFIRQPVETGD